MYKVLQVTGHSFSQMSYACAAGYATDLQRPESGFSPGRLLADQARCIGDNQSAASGQLSAVKVQVSSYVYLSPKLACRWLSLDSTPEHNVTDHLLDNDGHLSGTHVTTPSGGPCLKPLRTRREGFLAGFNALCGCQHAEKEGIYLHGGQGTSANCQTVFP